MGNKPLTKSFGVSMFLAACVAAHGQSITNAYNRDNEQQFSLKNLKSKSIVKGPIVKQETVYDFANPFKKLTEASVWFDLNNAAVLTDFGYWYKREFVPGVLMDKSKAWFIYTAITSRNEDPGIMVQTDTGRYHTQIYPLASGYDFRLKLSSVGFLQPEGNHLVVPQQEYDDKTYSQDVFSAKPETLQTSSSTKTIVDYPTDPKMDMQVYAQRHRYGYTYVAGIVRTDQPNAPLQVSGIHKVFWARPDGSSDGSVKYFVGRRKGAGTMRIVTDGQDASYAKVKYIKANERGTDTAKLWAHQKLAQEQWHNRQDVVDFSLKYQVPSAQTALLAVPKQEMRLFRKKAAEYRRKQAEEARRARAWQGDRSSNYSYSSGGDPEIRVFEPSAEKAYAVMPDGQQFDLVKSNTGYWGGNFDIPANAPEGNYDIRVVTVDRAGQEKSQTVSYQVDRTAPTGVLKMEDGFLVLTSEAKLARIVVVFSDGTEGNMAEITPGVYKIPVGGKRVVKVELIDRAHNIGELRWSN
jgi:hypothetical protein